MDARAKRSLLVELFANPELTRTLVFTRTKRGADRVAQHLAASGISVAAIHGNKSQNQREAALAQFKVSKIRVLVATDVAARGIDIDLVTHVVNYELPNVPESYVHRIGRTARAGAEGIAISLCDAEERDYLRDIERLTRQSIETTDRRRDPSLELAAESARENSGRRQFRSHGQSGKPKAHSGERHGRPDSRGNRSRPHRGGNHESRNGAGAPDRRNDEPRPRWALGQPRSAAPWRATTRPMPGRHNGEPRPANGRPDTAAAGRIVAATMNAATAPTPRTGITVSRGLSKRLLFWQRPVVPGALSVTTAGSRGASRGPISRRPAQ